MGIEQFACNSSQLTHHNIRRREKFVSSLNLSSLVPQIGYSLVSPTHAVVELLVGVGVSHVFRIVVGGQSKLCQPLALMLKHT